MNYKVTWTITEGSIRLSIYIIGYYNQQADEGKMVRNKKSTPYRFLKTIGVFACFYVCSPWKR